MRFLFQLFFYLFLVSVLAQSKNQLKTETDSVSSYLELATFYNKTNEYNLAIAYAQKAFDYAKSMRNPKKMAQSYAAMGAIYFEINKFEEAAKQYTKCLEIADAYPASNEQAYSYFQLALCQIELKQYLNAELNLENAKNIYSFLRISDAITLIQLQMGIVKEAKGDFDAAKLVFNQLILQKGKKDPLSITSTALYHLGNIELQNFRYRLALYYLNKAEKTNGNNNLILRTKILLALSKAYEKSIDMPMAYANLKLHMQLEDSLINQNRRKFGPRDFDQFQENERLKTIEKLDKENKAQQKASRIANIIIILSIAFILILSLLSISLYKNNLIRKKSNVLLEEKNQELELAKTKAEKANKARADFLSTVSHELRTPLNAINGITHLLLEENPKASQLDYLNSLKFSGNYLLTFINEILEINRIESEAIEVEQLSFNLKELTENLQNSLKELAIINNNRFSILLDPAMPSQVVSDPTKLSQILLNLINNALKFTKNGEVHVTTKVLQLEGENINIEFKIADTGIGIPEDKLESVFDSFSQGSIEINRKYGGTGLGLSIVKRLIEILSGTITLESQVGKGSTFTVVLPFRISKEDDVPQNQFTYNDHVFKNKKVLLIEDNKINQMITKKMVENKAMICEVIDNGEDAIQSVKNNRYDLVLMDVHLPGINGTIATQTIRTFDTQTKIIALTAISLNENREMLLSFGMNDVITKPFNPEEFYHIICKNLEA
ncbi:MAG: response regulator [Flavobacterium sp.]|nr:response regulator [Flavobacterium sp.]